MDEINENSKTEEVIPASKDAVVLVDGVDVKEYEYKITKRGNKYMAFKRSNGSEWSPLLYDYSLPTSAIGVLETEMVNDIYGRGRK